MFRLPLHKIAAVACVCALAAAALACDAAQTRREATPAAASSRTQPAAVTTARSGSPCAPPYSSRPATITTVFCADPSVTELARVTRIIDGDTLEVEVDGREETIRIFGIDTPERGQPCFSEASDALRTLASSKVRLLASVRERDRNGRLLRYVYMPDGLSIDAMLVAGGLARAWRQDGELRDALILVENRARESRTGCLWEP